MSSITRRTPTHFLAHVQIIAFDRGAAFEKAGKYAQALSECVLCLAREPDHPLARVRKSRVLEALGRPVDALSEVCAHLLLERDRFQAKVGVSCVHCVFWAAGWLFVCRCCCVEQGLGLG